MLKTAPDALQGTLQARSERQSVPQVLTNMAGVAIVLQLRPLSLDT